MEINQVYVDKECCFVCNKRDDCIRVCQFYKGARKYHTKDTVMGAVCSDPERCIKCENVFERLKP
jgi:hypothetical protein